MGRDGSGMRAFQSRGFELLDLLGASTSCQACLEYTDHERYRNAPVDGYILLNPVSDRQAASLFLPQGALGGERPTRARHDRPRRGKRNDANVVDPAHFPHRRSRHTDGNRWVLEVYAIPAATTITPPRTSNGATVGKQSSDGVDAPILSPPGERAGPSPGERDETVPPSVDRRELLERWRRACPAGYR
ncbi:hypothetical protein LX32DRAFT_702735 [Colletotrichum zoysiae]|uniref:Uncharacterized protein n=1 Tax=Colletotrichum zoysiae TaxID=1216348 RepID=A0AAD9HBJ2_9PEZI|nr:hypothetical protein LX32DRAFT_702735 [Colletotrichum zoysiae]